MTDYKDRVSGCATDIDWSKAPEGATHYQRDDGENWLASWIKKGESDVLMAMLDDGKDTKWGPGGLFSKKKGFLIARPAPQWNGEGLPPAGCECEYFAKSENRWIPVVMIGAFRGELVLGCEETGVTGQLDSSEYQLRPRRTPAQIAAEEREAAIEAMWKIYWQPDAPTAKEALGLLWDAGLRFQKGDDQ